MSNAASEKRPRPFVLLWLDWIYSAAGPRSEIREVLSTIATRIDDDGTRAFQSHPTIGRRLNRSSRTISRRCRKAVDQGWLREVSGGDGKVIVYRATLPPHVQQLISCGHTPDKYVSGVAPDKLVSGVTETPPPTSLCRPTPDKPVSSTPDKLVSDDRLLTVTLTGIASKQQPARLPDREKIDEEHRIRIELKKLGVLIQKRETWPQRWVAEGMSRDRLTAAVHFIRKYRKKPEGTPIHAAYLDEIVHDETAVDPIASLLGNRPPADPEHEAAMRKQDEENARRLEAAAAALVAEHVPQGEMFDRLVKSNGASPDDQIRAAIARHIAKREAASAQQRNTEP